jgi:peptidoglycan/LPS O-acetylase OafA/YrhL
MKELIRVLFAIFRYPAAVVVAFMASIATSIHLPDLFQMWDPNDSSVFGDSVCFFSTGLVGVTTGSFCLPRNQRWIGSLCLLFLGLGFAFCISSAASEDDSWGPDFSLLMPLAAGGIIPVVIHYLLKNNRPIETSP